MVVRYANTPQFIILVCLYISIIFFIISISLITKNKSFLKIFGEIIFGLGIGVVAGAMISYDIIDDTTIFLISSLTGLISLSIGSIIKYMA